MHTPLIVHWPNGLKRKPGTLTDSTGHVMDVMPTCLDLARATYPRAFQGRQLKPLEGLSLLPILNNKARKGHDALFFEHAGGKAILAGGYKLVQPSRSRTWELYDIDKDRTETTNLADRKPAIVRDLVRRWQAWAKRVGVDGGKD